MRLPSADTATQSTSSVCPFNTSRACPFLPFQILAVPSELPVTSRPSRSTATEVTDPVWPRSVWTIRGGEARRISETINAIIAVYFQSRTPNTQRPTPNAQHLTPNTQHLTPNLFIVSAADG